MKTYVHEHMDRQDIKKTYDCESVTVCCMEYRSEYRLLVHHKGRIPKVQKLGNVDMDPDLDTGAGILKCMKNR